MNRVNVAIHIIPSGIDVGCLEDFDPIKDGRALSTEKEIKVNNSECGYSIVYPSSIFKKLNIALFSSNLVKIFQANVPNTIMDVIMYYHYETLDSDVFELETAESVMAMHTLFSEITASKRLPIFDYHITDSIVDMVEEMQSTVTDNDDEEDYDADDIYSILGRIGVDGDDDDDSSSGKKKDKDYYGRSRSFKDCKDPKKCIRRHGVIIADSKRDIEKDEKIIKDFLKDFIPGNAGWKKEFRREVCKRWIRMYTVSKKQLKQLEKEHRRSRNKKKNKSKEQALDFTRRLFSVPLDRWNDPTR